MSQPTHGFDHEKLSLGAGVISTDFMSAPTPSWTALFATRGGSTVTVVPQIREIEVDNVKAHTKELNTSDGTEVKLSTVVLNADIASINRVLAGSSISGSALSVADKVSDDEYTAVYFITWLGDGKIGVHKLDNAIATNGLNYKTNNKGETELTVEFTAYYTLDALDTVPYSYNEYTVS